ncbi:MAG: hypothetical protein RRA94_07315 [Bacteroidota bacterium]|nr:hypothetical protein [Bacteroidota bacterium]
MPISLLSRLFLLGRIPANIRATLETEDIIVADENIRGWIVFKDFRAPGKRFKHRAEGFAGFLVITRKRVIAQAFGQRVINIMHDHPKARLLHMDLPQKARIEFSFEASDFHDDRSGRVIVGFKTDKAGEFLRAFESMHIKKLQIP